MDDYQLGFTHACRLIKRELEKVGVPAVITNIIDFVENKEIEQIKKDIGI